MHIHILTIFPNMFSSPFAESIVNRAMEKNLVEIYLHDLRQWTNDNHKTVDDHPFGGGPGMVMLVEPIYKALQDIHKQIIKSLGAAAKIKVVLTSAKGKLYKQTLAKQYSKLDALIIICGHYEGVDERVAQHLVDDEVSIGEYVLTGGEIPAMAIVDSITRLLPGVVGNEESLHEESFDVENKKEYPHYTRPALFETAAGEKWPVPDVLLSGNHKQIEDWRKNLTSSQTSATS